MSILRTIIPPEYDLMHCAADTHHLCTLVYASTHPTFHIIVIIVYHEMFSILFLSVHPLLVMERECPIIVGVVIVNITCFECVSSSVRQPVLSFSDDGHMF